VPRETPVEVSGPVAAWESLRRANALTTKKSIHIKITVQMNTTYNYWLNINAPIDVHSKLDEILNVKSEKTNGDSWIWIVVQEEHDDYFDFINIFLNILTSKKEELSEIGISFSDITFWMIYWYDSQCNIEFDAERMKRLGDYGIGLCISCYDIHEYNEP
jgi:hypothetical protein